MNVSAATAAVAVDRKGLNLQVKRFVRSMAAVGMALGSLALVALPGGAQVTLTVNGDDVLISPAPIEEAGRVFVPLRGVFERLGASVVYSNGTINATGNGRTISLQIGSTQTTVNGEVQTIDVAPFIVGGSSYVPVRFVSEALGAGVSWDDAHSVVAIDTGAGSSSYDAPPSYAASASDYADSPPPPIPVYEQPYVPDQNAMWQPGYWAGGRYGYYWVPGTWVDAPQRGYLWTPGYWGWNNGGYGWKPGYWATAVGFYGGVNYGCGYDGNGYDGGRWSHNAFSYNTYVTRVNTSIVRNVYTERNVYINNSTSRTSFNGGPNGLRTRPTTQQLAVVTTAHLGMTPGQQEHLRAAALDRGLLASVNHNRPPIFAVMRPLSSSNRPAGFVPVTATDRLNIRAHPASAQHVVPKNAPTAVRPAPAHHAAAGHAAPSTFAPPVRPVPANAVPVAAPAAPNRTPRINRAQAEDGPTVHPVKVEHGPAILRAPPDRAPIVHPTQVEQRPTVHTAPVEQKPTVHPALVNHVPPVPAGAANHAPLVRPAQRDASQIQRATIHPPTGQPASTGASTGHSASGHDSPAAAHHAAADQSSKRKEQTPATVPGNN